MRTFILSIGLSLCLSTLANADSNTSAIAGVPPSCAGVASVPTDATIATPSVGAKIAAASCVAELNFNALHLAADDASIAALTAAAKQSLEWLDAAIQQNDPAMTPIAQKARMDLFLSMAVRMRNSIPAITMQTVGAPLAEHDQQHAALEPKLKPWLDQAH